MAHLEILVHRGCLSEQSVRTLAREIQSELPNWDIDIRLVKREDPDRIGHPVFPAILIDGQILTTGIPQKDWLLMKLREWDGKNDK